MPDIDLYCCDGSDGAKDDDALIYQARREDIADKDLEYIAAMAFDAGIKSVTLADYSEREWEDLLWNVQHDDWHRITERTAARIVAQVFAQEIEGRA